MRHRLVHGREVKKRGKISLRKLNKSLETVHLKRKLPFSFSSQLSLICFLQESSHNKTSYFISIYQ